MITELLGIAGSGVCGSIFGFIQDYLNRKHELEIAREESRSTAINRQTKALALSPVLSLCLFIIVLGYIGCCVLCICFPDVPLATFNPDQEPTRVSFLFGIIQWEHNSTKVWTITTGGVGYALLHPLAFVICAVFTGITPMTRR